MFCFSAGVSVTDGGTNFADAIRLHKLMGYHHGIFEDREFRNLCHLDGVVRRQPCSIAMVAALAYIQQMRDAIAPKPRGFTAIGVFLFFGAVMATFAATTLLRRGTPLDRLWALNPTAYNRLAPLGGIVVILFLVVGAALITAGIGWFRRRLWGWRLAVVIIWIQVAGDVVNCVRGDWLRGGTGVIIAGGLLLFLLRSKIRAAFA